MVAVSLQKPTSFLKFCTTVSSFKNPQTRNFIFQTKKELNVLKGRLIEDHLWSPLFLTVLRSESGVCSHVTKKKK